MGRYQLEAALQSAHVDRCRTGEANWAEVVQLYDALFAFSGSPVVAVNRALAMAERGRRRRRVSRRCPSRRPMRGWRNISLIGRRGRNCWRVPARGEEARQAYEIAIGLERDEAVRRFLQRRQAALR